MVFFGFSLGNNKEIGSNDIEKVLKAKEEGRIGYTVTSRQIGDSIVVDTVDYVIIPK